MWSPSEVRTTMRPQNAEMVLRLSETTHRAFEVEDRDGVLHVRFAVPSPPG